MYIIKEEIMTSYKNSGFKILVINENCGLPRNYFVIDRFIYGNKSLPPPPKHFKYIKKDRKSLCFYKLIEDKNDPLPPASLLCLSKMSTKKLKAIASENDLGSWRVLVRLTSLDF